MGIAIVHRTDGKDPRTDKPGREVRAGDRGGVRPPPDAGGVVARRGDRMGIVNLTAEGRNETA